MSRLTTVNIPQLSHTAIGFDKFFDAIEKQFANNIQGTSFPPYNIVKVNDDEFLITMAVAGFKSDDIEMTQTGNNLVVEGKNSATSSETVTYLHKGIASRNFRREFTLADYVNVTNTWLEDGMLNITLVREIPEEKQPKKIQINTAKSIENK